MSEKASASTTVKSEPISQGYEIVADLSSVSFSFRADFREFGNDAMQAVADLKNGAEHSATLIASNSQEGLLVYLSPIRKAQNEYVAQTLAT